MARSVAYCRCAYRFISRKLFVRPYTKSSSSSAAAAGLRQQDQAVSSCDSSSWVPHPRSGIYVPQGQEWVINDVPDGAASFGGRTFWLRTLDATVDVKPDPDTPTDHLLYNYNSNV